ncbi:phosphatidate cytidylyltransferase protein [Rutstroemia sp. NJR-2017a BBW]|nr:phosphatidate cytidylyltransferase protein [Rutstroemia sp. NJR-2017a BBW]
MPEQLKPITPTPSHAQTLRENAVRRRLSRSPHPYHKHNFELPYASEKVITSVLPAPSPLRSAHNTDEDEQGSSTVRVMLDGRIESTNSDSGTEADDEHFLKGLPAPKIKAHKGLRGENGLSSSSPSPLLSPAIIDDELQLPSSRARYGTAAARALTEEEARRGEDRAYEKDNGNTAARIRWRHNIPKSWGQGTGPFLEKWCVTICKLACQFLVTSSLIAIYPLRLLRHLSSRTPWKSQLPLTLPIEFDPAPLLYPPILSMLVAVLLSVSDPNCLLPSMILAISTLPKQLVPAIGGAEGRDHLHWFLACTPLFTAWTTDGISRGIGAPPVIPEILVLLPALHQALCTTLHYLTTTSLLSAELQLLSTALISLLIRASSPQAVILKSLLWGGGVGVLVTCTHVLRWGVALARVPKWRFKRPESSKKLGFKHSRRSLSIGTNPLSLFGGDAIASDSSEDDDMRIRREHTLDGSMGISENTNDVVQSGIIRRYTSPSYATRPKSNNRTPSGRKKRSSSQSVQAFFNLTYTQAQIRKWLYAGYVYLCVLIIILVGIREYVGRFALHDQEPIGWALAYLFGDLPWFRLEVVKANLQRWIPLPSRVPAPDSKTTCSLGWVEHIRHSDFGPANTRLILCAYWLTIIIVGLAIVFRLSAIYEVDTRRKVFHFMMVAMLLPATYIDPTFAALALALMLAIFLLLDLFRASQLPPLSKSLAYFLTPYVDGRDLKGPVVISHIFLLIGCAIPLWLSLGAAPRVGDGWDVPQRETSMVSGVICVGMGDAAASLIGRRFGRRKWIWGGGKSIEGSVAFAVAVGGALVLAKAWLRVGGWRAGDHIDTWGITVAKAGVAATVASLTEAVLTGGNDNVVVPVVLWCCVKGLGI